MLLSITVLVGGISQIVLKCSIFLKKRSTFNSEIAEEWSQQDPKNSWAVSIFPIDELPQNCSERVSVPYTWDECIVETYQGLVGN